MSSCMARLDGVHSSRHLFERDHLMFVHFLSSLIGVALELDAVC